MKPRFSRQRNQALTLLEVVVAIAVLLVLSTIFLSALTSAHKAKKIECDNNLKQIGLSYEVWAIDHYHKFPMQTSVADGGIKELFDHGSSLSQFVCLNYFVMAKELSTPKILRCPEDTHGVMAANFSATFNNANISFFANPDADQMYPQTVLSGDDNFAIGSVPVSPGILNLPGKTPIVWTDERHGWIGNVGLADGSVLQLSAVGLQQAFQPSGTNSIRLAIP